MFAFESENNVMEDKELGITSGISSLLTPEDSVAHIRQMQACPYTAKGTSIDVLIDAHFAAKAYLNYDYSVPEEDGDPKTS